MGIDQLEELRRIESGLVQLIEALNSTRTMSEPEVLDFNVFIDRINAIGGDANEWRILETSLRSGGQRRNGIGRWVEAYRYLPWEKVGRHVLPTHQYVMRLISEAVEGNQRGTELKERQAVQESLYELLREAYRTEQQPFRGLAGDDLVTIYHPGLPGGHLVPNWEHMLDLAARGLLSIRQFKPGQFEIRVSSRNDEQPGIRDLIGEARGKGTIEGRLTFGPGTNVNIGAGAENDSGQRLTEQDGPITAFIAYARSDKRYLANLKTHLSPLKRQGKIEVWYDGEIVPGQEWEDELREKLESSTLIVLLISPSFTESEYCYGTEMARALERHEAGSAAVVPVIIRPVLWKGLPFQKLQMLPDDAKAVSEWKNKDRAWVNVVEGINKVIARLDHNN